jgi:hypothetical protein
MSVHLHPVFACVWLLEIGTLLWLGLMPKQASWFGWYIWLWGLREVISFSFSWFAIPYSDYLIYVWTTQFLLHLMACIVILRCVQIKLPRSIFGNFLLSFGVLTVMCVMWSTGKVQWVEGTANLWIAILAWVVWARIQPWMLMDAGRRALPGFLILYSGGVVTSWIWALRPAPQPAVWAGEFLVQGAALAWWLRTSLARSPRR